MGSRDLEQEALLAELQRTVGGNAAEVLETVVETMQERADLSLVARSLTAQGRMARWILMGIPVLVAAFLTLIQPGLMKPLFEGAGGLAALVAAGLMVVAASLVIQRIVDVKASEEEAMLVLVIGCLLGRRRTRSPCRPSASA